MTLDDFPTMPWTTQPSPPVEHQAIVDAVQAVFNSGVTTTILNPAYALSDPNFKILVPGVKGVPIEQGGQFVVQCTLTAREGHTQDMLTYVTSATRHILVALATGNDPESIDLKFPRSPHSATMVNLYTAKPVPVKLSDGSFYYLSLNQINEATNADDAVFHFRTFAEWCNANSHDFKANNNNKE